MAKINHRAEKLMAMFVLILLTPIIPDGWSMDTNGYQNISIDRFVQMMDQKDFVLINVHIPYAGEIPETDLLIPFDGIEQHKNELPNDKHTKSLFIACQDPWAISPRKSLSEWDIAG